MITANEEKSTSALKPLRIIALICAAVIGTNVALVYWFHGAEGVEYMVNPDKELRIRVRDRLAAASLKTQVYSAQLIYKMDCKSDYNFNDIGEYAFLSQLVDNKAITGSLAENLNDQDITATQSYKFTIFLPDGRGGMYRAKAYEADTDKAQGVQAREEFYLAMAWPDMEGDHDYPAFIMFQDGQVRGTNDQKIKQALKQNPSWKYVFKTVPNSWDEVKALIDKEIWSFWSFDSNK